MIDITIAIDKLDKIGIDKVKEELSQKALTSEQINIIERYLNISGTNEEKLEQIRKLFEHSETGKKGINELEYVLSMVSDQTTGSNNSSSNLYIDFTLARGLNYYTGIIFEVKAPSQVKIGSIGGGGRYDDLTGLFGVPNIPGAGISFGVDRIYDVLEELQLFPQAVEQGTRVLFFNLGIEESKLAYTYVQEIREQGISAEIFHEAQKMDKQFKYAEKKNIPYVAIIGTKELETKTCNIKDIRTGEQKTISLDEVLSFSFA
jgi:histidyl-tRNA synthetase